MRHNRLAAVVSLLLCVAVFLSGCSAGAAVVRRADSWKNAISWQEAFRTKKVPNGRINNQQVAYAKKENGETTVETVPLKTAASFDDKGFVPRETFYLGKYDSCLEPVFCCISYAAAHGFDCFVMPMDEQTYRALCDRDRSFAYSFMWTFNQTCAKTVTDSEGSKIRYVRFGLEPHYFNDSAEGVKQQTPAHEAALELLAAMPADCDTDYEKVLYFYSWLTENVRYDQGDYYETMENLYYDTLVNRSTVCAGYAWTLSWLCGMAGLESLTVTGQVTDISAHAWNIIRVDGTYYWFDSTWDEGRPEEAYRFFGVSDAVMEYCGYHESYQFYSELLPDCPENLLLPNGEHVIWEYMLS